MAQRLQAYNFFLPDFGKPATPEAFKCSKLHGLACCEILWWSSTFPVMLELRSVVFSLPLGSTFVYGPTCTSQPSVYFSNIYNLEHAK